MAKTIGRNEETPKGLLWRLAEERLRDFQILKEHGNYQGAVYLAHYAIELFLKYSICHHLKKDKLHVQFHVHELWDLLYFTGLEANLEKELKRYESFKAVAGQESNHPKTWVKIRYQDPSKFTSDDCKNWDTWLYDSSEGLVPWFKERLQ